MSISALVKNVAAALLTPLLPQSCLLCAADSGNALLCPDCESGLPRLPARLCPGCALPTPNGETCGACLKRPPHFDATVAAFAYSFPVDKLVQQFKFAHRLAIADFFARFLLPPLFERGLPAADLIVPVPLSPRRLRERGFNQAAEVAKLLGRRSGLPVDLSSCRRTLETPPQSTLPWKERRRNVRGVFECAADLTGRRIVVVDDVMTTGSTLDELARVLRDHGAAHVTAAVVARTVRNQ